MSYFATTFLGIAKVLKISVLQMKHDLLDLSKRVLSVLFSCFSSPVINILKAVYLHES